MTEEIDMVCEAFFDTLKPTINNSKQIRDEVTQILSKKRDKTYVFDDNDFRYARDMARIKLPEVRKLLLYADRSDEDIINSFYKGYLGERAFFKLFHDELDIVEFNSVNYGDDGEDSYFRNYGNLINDTKTSFYNDSVNKMVSIKKIYPKTDIYTVMSLNNEMTQASYKGFLWKKDAEEKRESYAGILGTKIKYIR